MNIRRIIFITCISLLLTTISLASSKQSMKRKALPLDGVPNVVMKKPETSRYMAGRVIVRLANSVVPVKAAHLFGLSALDNNIQRYSVESIEKMFPENMVDARGREIDLSKFYILKYTLPMDAFKVAEELSQLPEIQYAEPWFIYSFDDVTGCTVNDQYRSNQWNLTKILADDAWCISKGDTTVVIGIIDSGVQWNHPDLAGNIWINPGEYGPDGHGGWKESNIIDDDGNGKIDDWHGWDFGGADLYNPIEDNDPMPADVGAAHGTHVSGIASAVTDNSIGVAGIGYKCKLLPVKVVSDNDPTFPFFGFQGIVYALQMGAKVINCSWGGSGASQLEQEIIDTVVAHGSLVVAAAGNWADLGNPTQYPASYRGVLSVASTGRADTKSSYSEYNEFVDVSALGDTILSTYYPNNYAMASGTSMATPLVSGLAALVASHFPSYTNLQIGEQVRISCDNINSFNPSYVNLLGKGRINAYNALTFSSPSLRMISMVVSDSIGGNNNKILEANENATIITTFMNYLQPTSSGAMIILSTADTNVQVTNGSYPIGSMGTYATASNSSVPFQIHIKGYPPADNSVLFTLSIVDGGYNDAQLFKVIINPTFATHNVNAVEVTLTNKGRIGFVGQTSPYGSGFVFRRENQLYEGGLIIGYSATKLVDVVRNDNLTLEDNDFSSSQIYNMMTPGSISAQDGNTAFTDGVASPSNRIGLQVDMYSYAFNSAEDSDYVILRYDIKNISGATVSNLYAGLFFDWDIEGDQPEPWLYNRTDFDYDRNTGYAWNAGMVNSVFCGARAFEGTVRYRGLVNNDALIPNRASKWSWISGSVTTVDSVQDIHFVISSGPFTIANGVTKKIGFAVIGGKTFGDFQTSADAALIKWNYIKKVTDVAYDVNKIPSTYLLEQNYPNPFNPITNIVYNLPRGGKVSLKIYDVLGREVASLFNGEQFAGRYTVPFDATSLSSGVYYYRLSAGEFSDVKKLMLLR